VTDAKTVRGTNPQYLVEKITRTRIYECKYWKEHCFALTAELMVDKAMELKAVGGTFGGNVKPTPFICLVLKMLQIQPEKDIVVEFIRNEDYKYVRALGAFYMRLVGTSLDCYKYLEPLYNDYRKMRKKDKVGDNAFTLTHMDEFIDELLHEERSCDIILPRIQKRYLLEDSEQLEPRISALEDDLNDLESDDEPEMKDDSPRRRSVSPEDRRRRSRSPDRRRRSRSRSRSNSPKRRSRRSPSPSRHRRHRSRSRSRSRSPRHSRRHRSRSRSPRRSRR